MPGLKLTLACGPYDRTEALERGTVRPEGIDLEVVTIQSPRALFDRFIHEGAFDVAEYGISTLIEGVDAGNDAFVGIPVFPSKAFRHGFIFVNRRAGIETPGDLEGKTIGTPLWVRTAAIWIRCHLEHDYGVDLGAVRWVQGAVEHAGAHGINPPLPRPLKPIDIVEAPPDRSLNDMLVDGKIDALIGSRAPEAMGRDPAVGRLFPDLDEIDALFGGDPWPYGIDANRAMLAALTRYMSEQGMTAREVPVEELFVPLAASPRA